MSFLSCIIDCWRKSKAERKLLKEPKPVYWIDQAGWLHGPDVIWKPIHPSWYRSGYAMPTMNHSPDAIIIHSTWTAPWTGENMANNRKRHKPFEVGGTSWHLTNEVDGSLIQMAPLVMATWHAGSGRGSEFGNWNLHSIGIEHVGENTYTEEQIETDINLFPVLVSHFNIPPERALISHSAIKPTKPDPGATFENEHKPRILAAIG